MICEYPCHVCDPEAWAEEQKRTWEDLDHDVERSFDGQMKNLERVFSKLAYQNGPWPPPGYHPGYTWWTLLTPWPEDIEFTYESDFDDISWGGRPFTTLITDERRYMRSGGKQWHILSYRQRADFEKKLTWVDAIQMVEPPDWGWWMPMLEAL